VNELFPNHLGGGNSDLLFLATQTVALVAYARQHTSRINGTWVFPMCVIVAFVVCFPSTPSIDLPFAQRAVVVAMLAFGAMVLRRGGNGATTPPKPPDDGRPSNPPPTVRSSTLPEPSPMTNMLMHVVPIVLLGVLFMPIIARFIR
jgi:hypothetical protein